MGRPCWPGTASRSRNPLSESSHRHGRHLDPAPALLKVAGWATLLNAVLGVAAAYGIARWRSSARDVVDAILTLPLVLPPTVLGYYLLVLVGRRGVFGAWLESIGITLVLAWQGAVLASTVVAFPLVLKSRAGRLRGGGSPARERRPRCWACPRPAIFFRGDAAAGAARHRGRRAAALARALGEFGATLMIAGNNPARPHPDALRGHLRGGAGRRRQHCQSAGAGDLGSPAWCCW